MEKCEFDIKSYIMYTVFKTMSEFKYMSNKTILQ